MQEAEKQQGNKWARDHVVMLMGEFTCFASCPRRARLYHRAVSDLLAGLLVAVLAANSPPDATNVAAPKADDPDDQEYRRILEDDDAAEKEVLGWMDTSDAFAKAGGGEPRLTLNLKIQKRLDVIKKEYEDFVERHPKHVNARLAFGSFLNDNNDQEGAFKQWEEARQLAPANPAAWNNLGNYYGQRGPATNAFKYYDKAIELNPLQPVYYHNLAATIYLFQNEAREYYHLEEPQVFDKSLALYRQAIKMDPANFILFSDYAETFYGLRPPRWKDGLEAWTEALKIARDEVEREGVRLHLARIHLQLGDYDQARTNLDAVTNANYAKLKDALAKNLKDAITK
jgi:tetratricopeptide (TPR) repeat protein